MNDLLTVVLLGIVEGLTEFIPVSSTGHLVLAGALLGFKDGSGGAFDIVIQLGAILAVVVQYWRTFWAVGWGLAVLSQALLFSYLPADVAWRWMFAIGALPPTPLTRGGPGGFRAPESGRVAGGGRYGYTHEGVFGRLTAHRTRFDYHRSPRKAMAAASTWPACAAT